MFAQLGDIVFEPLVGFDSVSDTDDTTIAMYNGISGKPLPVFMAPGLRQITLGISLHQRFIIVKQARIQLRANKDQGDILTLTWGTGDVEGQFLIQSIGTELDEMDTMGNVFGCKLTVTLLEVPDGFLYASKQGSAYKAAFAANPKAYPPVVFKPPVPAKPKPWQVFTGYVDDAINVAGMIDALSYGGQFPNLGSSLGAIIGNADANMALMQDNFATWGSTYDMDDITSEMGDVRTALTTLGGINPVTDPVNFKAANKIYQAANRLVCF